MTKIAYSAAVAFGLLASGAAFGQTSGTATTPMAPSQSMPTGKLSDTDQKFVNDAAVGGMFEVEAGKLAEKSTNSKVKQFGARMVRDHSAADAKLKQIVTAQGGNVPNSLDQEHQQKLNQLASLRGQDFARQYTQMMVEDHDTDAQKFGQAAQTLNDPQLKQFAAQTLKTIQTHDKLIHQIADQTAAK